MNLELSTPALLFPAISLLLLAYTNRFFTTAQLIRGLSANTRVGEIANITLQIENLKKRMDLIKLMQILGMASLLACTVSMFLLFLMFKMVGSAFFGFSLLLMMASLITAIWEISISTAAIELELAFIKDKQQGSELIH